MKYKQLVMIFGLAVGTVWYTGCSGNSTSTQTESTADANTTEESEETEENVVYGQVKEISDDGITIQVGTKKQMEKPEESSKTDSGETGDSGDTSSEEQPEEMSMLELTDEEKEIVITEATTFQKGGVGPMGGTEGEAPAGGEKPEESGEAPAGGEKPEESGEAPAEGEKPEESGEVPTGGGSAPAQTESITREDIQEGDEVAVTLDEDGNAESITLLSMGMGGGGQAPGGMDQSAGVESYSAQNDYTEDAKVEGEELTSTGTDESAVHVSEGAAVDFSDVSITRQSDDSTGGDNSSFYGVGAAFLVTDGTATVKDSTIETDADGGAGLFAYGDGIIYAQDTTITTKQDTSGGVHVAGGGTLYGWNLTAETNGTSSAAIRSDRGGGTMVIDGGTYTSNGSDSPAVYCTADIAVNDAKLTSNGAEAVCIEGLNSLHLYDCDLTGNLPDDERNDTTWNVILYQSMSGDSEIGNSTFEMKGGSLTGKNGGMFYTTNTESTITLTDVDITYAEENDYFLKCTGNQNQRGWGTAGANGADCLFTSYEQEMEGDVIWDSISTLDFYMLEGSTLTGGFVNDETCVEETGDGACSLTMDKDSKWIVTKDSTLTSLNNEGTIVDEDGNTVTIQGEDGTVYVKGDSAYTITVKTYQDSADTTNAAAATDWSAYQKENSMEA